MDIPRTGAHADRWNPDAADLAKGQVGTKRRCRTLDSRGRVDRDLCTGEQPGSSEFRLPTAAASRGTTCPALAQEDLAARVKKAQDAARANAASPQGREWKQRNSSATGRLLIPVLNRCLPESAGDIPTVFSVYIRAQAGRVREVVTELDASLGQCMTAAAREMPFPEAPRDDYWRHEDGRRGLRRSNVHHRRVPAPRVARCGGLLEVDE